MKNPTIIDAETFHRDLRLSRMADAAVVMARHEVGPITPEDFEAEAYYMAIRATRHFAKMVYEADAEITALRLERDMYRELVEKSFSFAPPRFIVPKAAEGDAL